MSNSFKEVVIICSLMVHKASDRVNLRHVKVGRKIYPLFLKLLHFLAESVDGYNGSQFVQEGLLCVGSKRIRRVARRNQAASDVGNGILKT